MTKPHIAVVGAGIVGICSAYFLNKSGFKVTLIDRNDPGTMTSYGHACTFADYACVPINSPELFKEIPSMLLKSDGPLAVDFFHIIKNLSWAYKVLQNCTAYKVEHISSSLSNLLNSASVSYDEIFSDVNVSNYIKNEESTVLINSNFNCGFYIDREKLFNILRFTYGINSCYDPCSYPGIQCEFYYNKNIPNNTGKQLSENNEDVIKISFMIFRTGSVLIVGKCNEEILYYIYNYIKDILKKEFYNIATKIIESSTPNKIKKTKKKFIYFTIKN